MFALTDSMWRRVSWGLRDVLMRSLFVTVLLLAAVMPVSGQYPVVPDSVKERAAAEEAEARRLSDSAWACALPTVLAEAAAGRPYVPWAASADDLVRSALPAFPGAEGGGAYTPGGRGGKVITVTSLADRGPGTLRYACEAGGARIVVFNVAGIIRLTSPIHVRAPYITIAGQTAPGDGVCVTGASFLIDTHDVVIRHMRFRRGATDVAFRDDALGGNAVGNIMIDHVSACWGLDENMSVYRHVWGRDSTGRGGEKLPTVNVTIQNSIFSEALDLYNHAFGATLGGVNSTFARNLFASNISRNCSIGMGGNFNFVNNVVFNWWNRTIDGGDHTSQLNIINNVFKPGPATDLNNPRAPIRYRIVKMEAGRDKEHSDDYGRAYVCGNVVWGNDSVTEDNWRGGVQIDGKPVGVRMEDVRAREPFDMPDVTIISADSAYRTVLDNVGATLPVRDDVDERVVRSVREGRAVYAADAHRYVSSSPYVRRRLPDDSFTRGIITDPRQVGGLPDYHGVPYLDSDGDGMPDRWEDEHGLDPDNPADANGDFTGDGYTNIEKYINSIH